MRSAIQPCCFLLFLSLLPTTGSTEVLAPAEALSYVRAGDLRLSPDASQIAYVETSYRWDWRPHLVLINSATGERREITPNGKAERTPLWSPQGGTLAFLSDRGGKTQIDAIVRNGNPAPLPAPLTARRNGVSSFAWSANGRFIAYLARSDSAPAEGSGPEVADDPRLLAHLWLLDVASKKSRMLNTDGYRIDEFKWQDSTHILLRATNTPRVEEYTDAVYRLSTAIGARLEAIAHPPQPFDNLIVSPDGRHFVVRSTGAGGPQPRDIFLGVVGEPALHDLSARIGLTVADVRWKSPNEIWMRVRHGFYDEIWRLPMGSAPIRLPLQLSVASFDIASDGTLAFVGTQFRGLPEIYERAKDGSIRQLGEIQGTLKDRSFAPSTIFKTRSFDGTEVEAALITPSTALAKGKWPLVLLVHGGPSSNFTAGYYWETAWAQLLAAHGYEVLMVNPRGSDGYNEEFLKANRGDWGGGDYKDLMAVLDAVIALGHTDPQRLGIGGWSYGGEMSEWAITQTGRFKAAVVGAGVFDQQAEFEGEDETDTADAVWYFGTPWEHPEIYARNSPATYIGKVHTPTLIFVGKEDAINPFVQSLGLYRALKYLRVETEMVVYPGEGHSPRKGSSNIDMFTRLLDWYDRHLGVR